MYDVYYILIYLTGLSYILNCIGQNIERTTYVAYKKKFHVLLFAN